MNANSTHILLQNMHFGVVPCPACRGFSKTRCHPPCRTFASLKGGDHCVEVGSHLETWTSAGMKKGIDHTQLVNG